MFRMLGLLGAALLVSCVSEDLPECRVGDVLIRVRVEKFRTGAPYAESDFEEHFNTRIDHGEYLLYKGGRLIERGRIEDAAQTADPYWVFGRKGLEFGDYALALVANGTEQTVAGNPEDAADYGAVYPGEREDRDVFLCYFPFTVDCTCEAGYAAVLQRVHGVVRLRIDRIPLGVSAVEAELGGVAGRKPLRGDFAEPVTAVRRVEVPASGQKGSASFVMGVFPAPEGGRSSWRLRLYGPDGTTTVYDSLVTDTLTVPRNGLLELSAAFRDEDADFGVNLDPAWDGSMDGGGAEVR